MLRILFEYAVGQSLFDSALIFGGLPFGKVDYVGVLNIAHLFGQLDTRSVVSFNQKGYDFYPLVVQCLLSLEGKLPGDSLNTVSRIHRDAIEVSFSFVT